MVFMELLGEDKAEYYKEHEGDHFSSNLSLGFSTLKLARFSFSCQVKALYRHV